MDWRRPYSTSYICDVLDPVDGLPIGKLEMQSCSISLSDEGVGMSATFESLSPALDYPYIRIAARCVQEGDVETVPLFTGKAHCTGRKWGLDDPIYEMEAQGLLDAASAKETEIGYTVHAYERMADAAARLIREAYPSWAVVKVTGSSPRLSDLMVAEDGETHLTLAEKLLESCGWRMRRLGNGDIEICEQGDPVARFDIRDNDVLMPDVTDQRDLYEATTVLRVVSGNQTVIVKNSDAIEKVGFERWETERDPSIPSEQTLDAYARNALAERNDLAREVSWTREYSPNVACTDTVEAQVSKYEVEGVFRVKSMDLKCEQSITVDEVVVENA